MGLIIVVTIDPIHQDAPGFPCNPHERIGTALRGRRSSRKLRKRLAADLQSKIYVTTVRVRGTPPDIVPPDMRALRGPGLATCNFHSRPGARLGHHDKQRRYRHQTPAIPHPVSPDFGALVCTLNHIVLIPYYFTNTVRHYDVFVKPQNQKSADWRGPKWRALTTPEGVYRV
jgi:hypothetical protein